MRTFRKELRQFVLAATVALAAGVSQPAFAGSTAKISGLVGIDTPMDMSSEELGSIELGSEFSGISEAANYLLRGRKITLDVGGTVPVQNHQGRPAMIYVIQGEIVEHRSDRKEPVFHRAGDCAVDTNGIAQRWENQTWQQVTLFMVDFMAPAKAGDR